MRNKLFLALLIVVTLLLEAAAFYGLLRKRNPSPSPANAVVYSGDVDSQ